MNRVQRHLLYKLPVRLVLKLRITEDGCWEWTGEQNRNGYGRVWWRGSRHMIHRLVWCIVRRCTLERSEILDHLCRNRLCCNPTHMSKVTVQQNTHRGKAVLYGPFKIQSERCR